MGCSASTWSDVKERQLRDLLTSRQAHLLRVTWARISADRQGHGFTRCCFKFFEEDSSLRSLFVRLALPIYQARQQAREIKDTDGNEDEKDSSPITVHLRTESVSVLKQNMPENHQYVRFRDSICQNPLWSISVQNKRDSLNSASCEPQTTEEKAKDSVLVCQSGLNSPPGIESDVGCGSAHHDGVHDAVPSRETKKTSCSSWTLLEGGDAGAGTSVDECMMRKHSLGVMEALGATVECLDDSLFLCDILTALGQIHASYNVKGHYLPRVWPAVRHGLSEVLGEMFTAEVEEAWRTLFTYIISKMKDGISSTTRRPAKTKKSSDWLTSVQTSDYLTSVQN